MKAFIKAMKSRWSKGMQNEITAGLSTPRENHSWGYRNILPSIKWTRWETPTHHHRPGSLHEWWICQGFTLSQLRPWRRFITAKSPISSLQNLEKYYQLQPAPFLPYKKLNKRSKVLVKLLNSRTGQDWMSKWKAQVQRSKIYRFFWENKENCPEIRVGS